MISGQRSRTGRPILANDPHLALTAPAIFYENEIRTPGFSAIGGSFPGVPFVIIGNTERFAWGVSGDVVALVLQREVAGVEQVQFRVGQIAQVRMRAVGRKNHIVLSPDDERGWPARAEECLELRI